MQSGKEQGVQTGTQFSIFLINKPGVLASVTQALAKARVNVLALSLSDAGEQGVLRLVPDDADRAREVLGKAHDRWTETEVILLELENRPGAFAKSAQDLADNHINITYAYCTGGAPGGKTRAVFKIGEVKKAMKVLGEGAATGGKASKKAPRTKKTNPSGRQGAH